MSEKNFAIQRDFAVFDPQQRVSIEANDEQLYQRLDQRYAGFDGHLLVSCHEFTSDWPSWEIHPAGDELVLLLAGEARFLLQHASGVETIHLSEAGSYAVIPRNTWHTAHTQVHSRILFMTPGAGTKNQAQPD